VNRRLTTPTWPPVFGAALAALALAASPRPAHASDHAAPASHGSPEGQAEAAAPQRTDILDLGAFRIRSTRSTDREVIDVKFSLCLVLSTSTTEADYERLVHWRHRLRDQAIIAVRTADAADFADPELRRLHRLILFRVKRLPLDGDVIGVYLSDFAVDIGEDVAEQYAPAIIPSAAPKKKPAEGGH
jgi:hypothetical protein